MLSTKPQIHGFDVNLPCMCDSVINKALKQIKKIRKQHMYYRIDIICPESNVKFFIAHMPDLDDDNVPVGYHCMFHPEADEEKCMLILRRIPA